ncbi:MAG: helix-turn-helix domain-containing protein [Anaerolineales bacterium]|nr:MAG: helix-turn-helix domain-containing protein [Anaerolineales bacterium]
MDNELSDRQQAIKWRLAGRSVEEICGLLGRSPAWFHQWWRRYRMFGPNGLFDLTRANMQPRRISPELERTSVGIRQRLASQTHPGTRYSLIGASSILAELQVLHIHPLPSARTAPARAPGAHLPRMQVPGSMERVLERNGETMPRVRLAPYLARSTYPKPQATPTNQLHQVDAVGPIYLKGKRQRYYILTYRDVYDGAVCLKLYRSRKMEVILDFLGKCWKKLGIPEQVQLDNAREIVGWGPAARYLSRVLRLCLRFGVEPLLIPPGQPQHNGSIENLNIENLNGWFQRHYSQVSTLRRELQRLEETVNTQHPRAQIGGRTPTQHRRRIKIRKLPPAYLIPTEPLQIAAGYITFFRQVTAHGNIHLLSQTFFVGKRLKGEYVKVRLDTKRAQLTVYRQGRIFKRWTYPFLKK